MRKSIYFNKTGVRLNGNIRDKARDEMNNKSANNKTANRMFASLFFCFLSFNAMAELNLKVDGYVKTEIIEEETNLRLSLDDKRLTGFLYALVCEGDCVSTRLAITPQTEAYYKTKQVPLKEAKSRLGRSAEIIYEVETKNVVRIRWW